MNQHDMKVCIQTLRELRARKYQHLDTSVTKELDAVLAELERIYSEEAEDNGISPEVAARALHAMATVLEVATNLVELYDRFHGGS